MTKFEILQLLESDFDQAIIAITEKYSNKYSDIGDVLLEYGRTPLSGSLTGKFRSKLTTLISLLVKEESAQFDDNNLDEKIYCALCDLDFKNQAYSFEYIYKKKTVSAFLIRGDDDSMIDDMKWCRNQLLKTSKLYSFDYIPIVYTDKFLNNDHTYLKENFKCKFNAEKLDNDDFRKNIEKRLETQSFVVIVENVGVYCNVEDFYKAFFQFYEDVLCHIRIDEKNHLIFLFIDYTSNAYETVIENHFKWYKCDEMDIDKHYAEAAELAESNQFKVIDLTPIESLNAVSILEWIDRNKSIDEIDKKFREYILDKSKINKFLDEGKSPYKIINKILSEMKIKLTDKPEWLKY